jgi:mono/diheme cytochrome c family protein
VKRSLKRPARHLIAAVGLLCAAASASCSGWGTDEPTLPGRDYVKDMMDSVPYDAFAKNPVFKDGKTLQPPAPGSIPRGWEPFDYGATPQEALRAGAEVKSPLPSTPANLARGDQVFHTVCYVCHGVEGKGDGPVIPRFPQPPSLLADHAKGLPDGQLFHIITRGQGLMPSHAAQVLPDDRWKVIQYIRSIQEQATAAAAAAVTASSTPASPTPTPTPTPTPAPAPAPAPTAPSPTPAPPPPGGAK